MVVDPPPRLLLVIDDEDLRMAFEDALSNLGYQVEVASDPADACARLDGPPPAAVLLDLPHERPGAGEVYALLRLEAALVDTAVLHIQRRDPAGGDQPSAGLVHAFEHPLELRTLLPVLNAVLGR